MKQFPALFCASLLLLSGCGTGNAASESSRPPQENNASALAPSVTYISSNENFSGEYRPSVSFREDGTFTMHENFYEGMGDYLGTYTFDGTYYECSVSDITVSGFAGDDIKSISFLQFSGNTLQLLTDLCGSAAKDFFILEGSVPDSVPEHTPDPSEARVYESTNDSFRAPYVPSLSLFSDGTFAFTENLYDGIGHYYGTYAFDSGSLTLTVTEIDFKGFAGDDVRQIHFEILQDGFKLRDDLCGSVKGDIFRSSESPSSDIASSDPSTLPPGWYRPVQEVGEITEERLYQSTNKQFEKPYLPSLVLKPDGTFVLTENLLEGMGSYFGTYEVDEYKLTLNVTKTDFKGYAGDDIKVIHFEALSKDVLQLIDNLCGSAAFDSWVLQNDIQQ